MKNIAVFRIGWIDQLFKLANKLTGFIFRGEGSYEYDFKSTLEREIFNSYGSKELTEKIEDDIFSEFKSIVKIHRPEINLDSNLEILSLLRHYGGPARFLDFTHSYYIALYFACLATGTTPIIWCFNAEKLDESLAQNIFSDNKDLSKDSLQISKNKLTEQCLSNEIEKNFLYYIDPPTKNKRLFYQQGTLLLNSNHKKTLQDCTVHTFDLSNREKQLLFKEEVERTRAGDIVFDDEEDILQKGELKAAYNKNSIVKIIIDPHLKAQALMKLDRMNINHQTLFPGLEGAAKYVTRHALVSRLGAGM
jgi:hypothetical protein